MKDSTHRSPRTRRRLLALAVLLSLAVGTAAQTHMGPQGDAAAIPAGPATTTQAPAAIPAAEAASVATAHVVPYSTHDPLPPIQSALEPGLELPAGFDVRTFEAIAQQMVAGQRVPGMAMAIVHKGKVLSARGYGITDVSDAEPVDAHTVFRLASLSKGFAGTMAGLLVADGAMRWDSRLVDYVPDFKLSRPGAADRITVADVLSHRVGLSRNTYDRDLEGYVSYRELARKLSSAPLQCEPGTCYAYQNVAFSLVGDIMFAATGDFYGQQVQRRLLKPLGMNDASLGLEGIESSARWAKPHVRGRGSWVSVMPKPTYYEVGPAAGVNASASDMAQWLLAQTGHRPDVIPAPLLATLHEPLVQTPGQTRSSAWRRARLESAGYGLGWRVYDYAGHRVAYHAGAVQGYRGMIAVVPELDLGIAMMWNGESTIPTGLLPTMLDRALEMPSELTAWLSIDIDPSRMYAETPEDAQAPGSSSGRASAAPE